jgi:hypothetical protein
MGVDRRDYGRSNSRIRSSERTAVARSVDWQAQRNRAARRRKAVAAGNVEPVMPVETVAVPNEQIIIDRGEIEIGEAFLRDARKSASIRGVSIHQVVAEMEIPYKKLLSIRVAGAEILAERAGRKMEDLDSIDVIKEKAPDGTTRELLKCNYAPEHSGQSFLRELRKGL